jgi:hypothetical protein
MRKFRIIEQFYIHSNFKKIGKISKIRRILTRSNICDKIVTFWKISPFWQSIIVFKIFNSFKKIWHLWQYYRILKRFMILTQILTKFLDIDNFIIFKKIYDFHKVLQLKQNSAGFMNFLILIKNNYAISQNLAFWAKFHNFNRIWQFWQNLSFDKLLQFW